MTWCEKLNGHLFGISYLANFRVVHFLSDKFSQRAKTAATRLQRQSNGLVFYYNFDFTEILVN